MKNRTYRYFSGDPLYSFGYGLSYSKFRLEHLTLSSTTVQAGADVNVELDITNTSERDGAEVAEIYITQPVSEANPIRALRGMQRVEVAHGTTKHVVITLNARDLSFVESSGDRVISPGEYQLTVGDAQPGVTSNLVQTSFQIVGRKTLPQ